MGVNPDERGEVHAKREKTRKRRVQNPVGGDRSTRQKGKQKENYLTFSIEAYKMMLGPKAVLLLTGEQEVQVHEDCVYGSRYTGNRY